MARNRTLLFLPMAGGVGIGPMSQLLSLAEAFELTGWRCKFACSSPTHRTLGTSMGFETWQLPQPTRREVEFIDFRLSDVLYCSGVLEAGYLRQTVRAEAQVIAEVKPAAIISASNLTAPITATLNSLPLISIAAGPDLPWFESPLYAGEGYSRLSKNEVNVVLSELGLPLVSEATELSFTRSQVAIAPTFSEFDPLLTRDAHQVTFVGPLLSMLLELRADPTPPVNPYIVVYINRGSLAPDVELALVSELCRALPDYSVAWVTANDPEPKLKNMLVVHEMGMARWLNGASLLISGGGYNALLSAVVRGVPIVVVPGSSAERYYNAQQIALQQCGVLTDSARATPAAIELLAGASAVHGLHERAGATLNGAQQVVSMVVDLLK